MAKVPERRTKMRRKKERKEVQAGGFADGKFSFSDGVCGACGYPIWGAVLER